MLPVYSSIDPQKVAMNLWFFDSGNRGCGGQGTGFGCIERDVVEHWRRSREPDFLPWLFSIFLLKSSWMVGWQV